MRFCPLYIVSDRPTYLFVCPDLTGLDNSSLDAHALVQQHPILKTLLNSTPTEGVQAEGNGGVAECHGDDINWDCKNVSDCRG